MCLVEVEKAPKPLPACATPVTAGMKVNTKSPKAKEAQRSVMEFLLINHPLDCPICDQGGECELQDISLSYGSDVTRFTEGKRSIKDDDLGPLIETEMTRCIHCTRCVRFGQEVAGIRELGATGRGENMQITTYVKHSLESEMSGNVIDLCPVGALTSKPFRFKARPWELQQRTAIAPHDCIGSNIYLHVRRQEVMRVAPRENESLNETWISDRDRFSYVGIKSADRLQSPLVKRNGAWEVVDWSTAFTAIATGLTKVQKRYGAEQIAALASPSATIEELYLLQKFMRGIGSNHIDHRLHQSDVADQEAMPLYPQFDLSIDAIETQDVICLIGSNLPREQPIAAHRVRKAALRGAQILSINMGDYAFNFPQAVSLSTAPHQLVNTLASIVKALASDKIIPTSVQPLLEEVSLTETTQAIAQALQADKKKAILIGALAQNHPQAATIRTLARLLAQLSGASCGFLTEGANSAGAWLAGAVPHRKAAGLEATTPGFSAYEALAAKLKAYILLGIEPELDCANSAMAYTAMQQADFVLALSPYQAESLLEHADVILPIATFAETDGTFVNVEGRWQSFNAAVPPAAEIKQAWKVLRVLGNQFELAGFEYNACEEIRDELQLLVEGTSFVSNKGFPVTSTNYMLSANAIVRITEWPIYAIDSLVRRSIPLQTSAANDPTVIAMNRQLAECFHLQEGSIVTAKQGEHSVRLPVTISHRIPDACVLIHAGRAETVRLGEPFGAVEIHVE